MKTLIKLTLTTILCSIASIKAMNLDQDLEQALSELNQQAEQDSKQAHAGDVTCRDVSLVLKAGEGNLEEVRKLIEQGANVNASIAEKDVDSSGNESFGGNSCTPLMAALQGCIQMLYGWGIVDNSYDETIKYLLAHNADINQPDKAGDTPLILALGTTPEIFKTILDKNPDVSVRNKKNETVLDFINKIKAVNDESIKVLRIDEKSTMLQDHLRKIEQADKAKIAEQAKPGLVAATNRPLANLIMDYVEGEYPLSDQMRLPFMPRGRSQDSVGFVKADTEK